MENSEQQKPRKKIVIKLSKLKPYLIWFCVLVLGLSYYQISKTTVPAPKAEIEELKKAAEVDKRPIVAEKLDKELAVKPHPKVWELNQMKEKLGLTYVDKEDQDKHHTKDHKAE
jgi:endo-1,4-beta-mannosidase